MTSTREARTLVVHLATAALPIAFLAVLVVWPLVAILDRSLAGVGVADIVDILGRDSFLDVLAFTVGQAALSTLLTLVIGLPIAHALARYEFRGRTFVRVIAVVPFVLPTVVVAAAFDALFDRLGLDLSRSLAAILAAHVFFNVAVIVRIVGGHWARIDRNSLDAARVLGATPTQVARSVVAPHLAPAVTAAAVLVFLFTFTSFGIILILGGPGRATLETEIYRFAVLRLEFDVAAVLALVQLVIVSALAVVSARFQRRYGAGATGRARPLAARPTGGRQHVHLAVVLVLTAIVIGLPIAALVEQSLAVGDGYGLDSYTDLAESVPLLPVTPAQALLTSLQFGVVAALVASIVGLLAAFTVARGRVVGKVLEAAALVPLGVSAVTLGFGYLIAFTTLDFRQSPWLVPLAHAVIGLPFVLAAVVPALRSIGDRQRQAAATLGASPAAVVRHVDWPQLRRPLLIGAGFAFAISLGEFGATSFVSRGEDSFTAPLAIFRLLSQPGAVVRGQALALSVVVGAIVAVVAAVLERRRGEGVQLL